MLTKAAVGDVPGEQASQMSEAFETLTMGLGSKAALGEQHLDAQMEATAINSFKGGISEK